MLKFSLFDMKSSWSTCVCFFKMSSIALTTQFVGDKKAMPILNNILVRVNMSGAEKLLCLSDGFLPFIKLLAQITQSLLHKNDLVRNNHLLVQLWASCAVKQTVKPWCATVRQKRVQIPYTGTDRWEVAQLVLPPELSSQEGELTEVGHRNSISPSGWLPSWCRYQDIPAHTKIKTCRMDKEIDRQTMCQCQITNFDPYRSNSLLIKLNPLPFVFFAVVGSRSWRSRGRVEEGTEHVGDVRWYRLCSYWRWMLHTIFW